MAKRDEVEIPDIRRHPITAPVTCGSCLFHKRAAVYARPCEELGTASGDVPCRHYVTDPRLLGDDAPRVFRVMAAATKPALVAATLLSARRVARSGYELGQRVYMRVMGGDFVSNYGSGWVAGHADGRVVVMGSEGYSALVFPNSLLDRESWEAKLKSLLKRERINDPEGGLRRIPVKGKEKLVKWEPPTLRGAGRRKRAAPTKRAPRRTTINMGAR